MFKKILSLFIALVALSTAAFADVPQPTDLARNDDAATVSKQPNGAPIRGSANKYGEQFIVRKPGKFACSTAATTTALTPIIAAAANIQHVVSSVHCHNNSTVVSILTLSNASTAIDSDIIGNTTLGNNRVRFEYWHPDKMAVNTALNFTMTTTGTSTICCADYVDVAS